MTLDAEYSSVSEISSVFSNDEISAIKNESREMFLISKSSGADMSFSDVADYSNISGKVYLALLDSSNTRENPGWPLRNMLVLLKQSFGISEIDIVCIRKDIRQSIVISVNLPSNYSQGATCGLEKNQGKLASRMMDLAPTMDKKILASTAVDLNLKLMRWRLVPDLDLEAISTKRCLLFGAGTLGCYVARGLMVFISSRRRGVFLKSRLWIMGR